MYYKWARGRKKENKGFIQKYLYIFLSSFYKSWQDLILSFSQKFKLNSIIAFMEKMLVKGWIFICS